MRFLKGLHGIIREAHAERDGWSTAYEKREGDHGRDREAERDG